MQQFTAYMASFKFHVDRPIRHCYGDFSCTPNFRNWQSRRHSVVVSALASISVVNQHCAQLLLGWVTACGQVKRLGM